MLTKFGTWEEVLAFARGNGWLWYHAPLDYRACSVRIVRVFKNGKIRIDAGGETGAFTIDAAHLDRMRRQAR